MGELQAISIGLTSIKTAIDIAKTLKDINKSFADAEVKLKIVDLMEKLADVREQMLDIKEENHSFRARINELENQLQFQSQMEFDGRVYWSNTEESTKEGPFCQKCYDSEKKNVRLQADDFGNMDGTRTKIWRCNVCHTNYDR